MPKLLHCPDCGELGYRRKVKRPEWRCREKSCGYEWDYEPDPLDSDEEQNSIQDNVDFSAVGGGRTPSAPELPLGPPAWLLEEIEREKLRPIRCPRCEKLTAYKTRMAPANHCTSCNYSWRGYGQWLKAELKGEENSAPIQVKKLGEDLGKIISPLAVPIYLAFLAGIAVLGAAVCNTLR
jgi:ribosomal protein L37AE/L43A